MNKLRPDLQDLFTPRPSALADRTDRALRRLDWSEHTDGVEVAAVPARLIDGTSDGIAGYVARTGPRRATKQADAVVWVGDIRVKVAPKADEKTEIVYHVGTGGPLFPTALAAGEAARKWRYGPDKIDQRTLPHV